MRPDDRARLQHIVEHAGHIAAFLRERTRDDLDADMQLLFAVVRALEIIGEATTRMSEEFKREHSDLPWAELAGMRNRLVHAYFDINREIVWNAATVELPPLAAKVAAILRGSS
jgi:uncharacterized protein with HEPN domain